MSDFNAKKNIPILLKNGIALAKAKNYPNARMVFKEVLRQDPQNIQAWLWMSQVVETDREKILLLKQVLRIDPEHSIAKRGVKVLESRQTGVLDERVIQSSANRISEPVVQMESPIAAEASKPFADQQSERTAQPSHIASQVSHQAVIPRPGIKPTRAATDKEIETPISKGNLFEQWLIRIRTAWKRFQIQLRLSGRRTSMFWEVYSRNRLAILGLILLFIYALMAISHPILLKTVWPRGVYDPVTGFDMNVMNPTDPSPAHIFGTDTLGRDVFSMLLAATTPAFILGLTASLVTAFMGIASGVSAAYFGGMTDYILTRIADAFLLLPAPIFMIIVGVAFHDFGPVKLGIIFGVINGLGGAMITLKSYAKTVLSRPFIQATKLSGGGAFYTIRRHLVPHVIPMAATLMMMAVISAVVADSFVSFTGIVRDHLTWGTMIYNSLEYRKLFGNIEWHVLIPPSIALSMFAASFYLISRGLHEVADPKLRAM